MITLPGPEWLINALNDPTLTDLCLNGASEIFVDRGNGMEPFRPGDIPSWKPGWTEEDLKNWVLEQISLVGKTWDAKFPFIDATLLSGHRLHVALPPLARQGILVSLRRLPQALSTPIGELASSSCSRWTDSPLFDRLVQAVQSGDSILISGATGSGKTTLATDLLSQVPRHERILALEDTPELSPSHPHFVSLICRPPNADGFGEITLRTLLRQALRMRPDRIILGECRGPEVLDLLQSLNTGHRGSLATLHANSPRDALRRVELLCLLAAGGAVPLLAIRELLSAGVQWITQVKRVGTRRRITELWRVDGREGETILLRPVSEA
jgi:pilus assembly protein CpaF